MKKKFIGLFACLFLSSSLFVFSLPNKDIFSMKMSTEFGIINGTVNEYVFADYCKNTDNMLSRLDWDVLAVPYFEGDLTFNFIRYIYFNINGRAGIPSYSGVMQDYDWVNSLPNSPISWQNDDPTQLTNYSKHNNKVNDYYNWSAKIGGNIPIGSNSFLTPYIGFKYDYIKMTASDGYRKYKSEYFRKINMYGKGISYIQESNSMILGLNFTLDFIPKLPIQTYIQFVPGVGQLVALDKHFAREGGGLAFLDQYDNIFQVEWKLSAFYDFNKHNRLGLSSFIQFMPLHKGVTGSGNLKPNGSIPDHFYGSQGVEGGAGRFLYSFSVIYQFNL